MNNTFSIQRFGLLLKRQWLEFGKIYLISLGVVFGIFLFFYGYNYYSIINFTYNSTRSDGSLSSLQFREPLFAIMGILFITIVASSYFAHLGQKSRAIIDLMIPASTFEKFMGGIFFASVLGIGSYLLLYYLTDLAFITKLRSWYEHSGNNMYLDGKKIKLNEIFPYFFARGNNNVFIRKVIYIVPILLTSIFLLGSIYFEKFHYIKTTICVMIFAGLWTAIIAKSTQLLFEGRIPIHHDQSRHILNEKNSVEIGVTLIGLTFTLIFWAITYVRLKEKEV